MVILVKFETLAKRKTIFVKAKEGAPFMKASSNTISLYIKSRHNEGITKILFNRFKSHINRLMNESNLLWTKSQIRMSLKLGKFELRKITLGVM